MDKNKFKLTDSFIEKYASTKPPFGFNGLGELVYIRTYSRVKEDGSNEKWYETVRRVVEGTYSMQKRWIDEHDLGWDTRRAQKSAQEMYDRIFNMKFLPPGRGLWAMGSPIIEEKSVYASLNNCGFVSTKNLKEDLTKPFTFLMDASMLGVGVGFDTKGANTIVIKGTNEERQSWVYTIPDSREGWVDSLHHLLESHFLGLPKVEFDYSQVRPAGLPIKGFGGVSSGPEPLKEMHNAINSVLVQNKGELISVRVIVDIMNLIGKAVVAGNVRRCLPKGTLIHTKSGLIKIEDIKPGMMAKTSNGYAEISELVHQGNQTLLNVNTQMGTFKCTPKHKFARLNTATTYEWVQAEHLQAGDRVVFVEGGIQGSETFLPNFTYDYPTKSTTCKPISVPELDSDFAWFLGVFHGDGYVYTNQKQDGFNAYVSVACSPDYPDVITNCQKQIQRFGVNLCDVLPKDSDKSYKVRTQSKQFAYFMSQFKTPNESIEVPDFILQGTVSVRKAYLAGLFDADGSKKDRPIILATSVYPEYLKQVQALYASVGIPTRLDQKRESIGNWKSTYVLKVVGERAKIQFLQLAETYSKSFSEVIRNKTVRSQNDYSFPAKWVEGFSPNESVTLARYIEKGLQFDGLVPVTVLNVEMTDEEADTYDISVPSAKEFVCQEGLLVHNTAEIVFGEHDSEEFINLKNYKVNPDREDFGWTSNNSIYAELGMDYSKVTDLIRLNGEPGLAWLDNMKNYSRMNNGPDYKDHRASGGNPCLEQTLESMELCCVSADTKIQTRSGVYTIDSLIGNQVEVWNGDDWSKVIPFIAATDKDLYRVHLSDGSYLDCTEDHKWSVKGDTKRVFKQVETKDLPVGGQVVPFELTAPFDGVYNEYAYEWGLFAGDGYLDTGKPMLVVCGQKSKLASLDVRGTWRKEQIKAGYTDPVNRLSFAGILDAEKAVELNDKTKGLPTWVFEMSRESILEFVAGYIETDGNVSRQTSTDNYRIFGVEPKMRDLQLLLRRVGINHASVYKVASAGEETNFGVRNYELWCCYIPSYECSEIPTRIKQASRFGSRYKVNNRYPQSVIDAARKQKITKVEKLAGKHFTYCFTEPVNNMGVFNNVLTFQCLVETFPNNHANFEDYRRTLKYAYLYAKTVTLGKTHWPETNRVLLRNRRIGCSMSGIAQFIAKNGIDTLKDWSQRGYDSIQDYDKVYSDWFAIPRSIKTTSVKPSGTVSLLAGATPGIHYPENRFYIRRVRLSKHSQLIKPLEKAGYVVEPAFGSEDSTVVVEIPVDSGEGVRTVGEVSMWEQLALAAFMQRYWADNQVSATITFDPETEGNQIAYSLNFYQYMLKGVSFLPRMPKGAYRQMPYEAITEDKYKELVKKLKPLNFNKIANEEAEVEKFCNNDVCEILPKKS